MIKCHSLLLVFMTTTVHLSTQQEQCQRVSPQLFAKPQPVAYNGIQPDPTECVVTGSGDLQCSAGEGVLEDGVIGPLDLVDVTDPDQVRQFYVWHQSNGTVELRFRFSPVRDFAISYINIYTLTNTAAGIGVPSSPGVSVPGGISVVSQQNCAFSSDTNTVMRTTMELTFNTVIELTISFPLTMGTDIEWLFLSEVELCQGTAPSPITCETPPTPSPQPTPSPSPSPTSPPPPTITLSFPPPTGVSVTPDPHHPDSVSLTCSVSSPTDGYQYQWQWWRNGEELRNDGQFNIDSFEGESTLQISGLGHSDAGEYMCTVEYAVCPVEVQCSSATGTFQLNLPVYVQVDTPEKVYIEDNDEVDLVCEVYGYPHDSFLPVWTYETDTVQNVSRHTITVSNTHLLNDMSISINERVVSVLTIVNVTEDDAGEYTCSVTGNSSTATLAVDPDRRPVSTSSSSNGGLIAGVVIAILIFLIVLAATLAVIIWMVWRHLKGNNKQDTCWDSFCAAARAKIPRRQHAPSTSENGSSTIQRRYTADDIEVQVYSAVSKKTTESPPPLPPQTLTEVELKELMKGEEDAELGPKRRSRVSTALSTYSYSGSSPPRLAKITNLKNFKMKENPLYESADEVDLDLGQFNVYALPSQPDAPHHPSNQEGVTESIYSEAIDPSMFNKRTSEYNAEEELHPYGPIYAQPSQLIKKADPPLEIGENNIREIKRLGIGQFGAVILAEIVGLKSGDLKIPKGVDPEVPVRVAVKKLKPDVSDEVKTNFDKEIKFMSQLRHENIVQLLAVCTKSSNPFIAMEYMENGDLNQFLQKYQLLQDDVAIYSNQLPPSVLVYMAIQIASGMCYLASLNYVHRDLATRNCLVGANFLVKISDFGMSRNLYERAYYRVRGRAMLPIRWMATESFYGRFSEKSDVWAYGVAVWEVFTLGRKQPYDELDDQEMIQDAIRGMGRRIMNKPPGCPQAVYEVMLRCWEYAAEDRATFKEIHKSLLDIQQQM